MSESTVDPASYYNNGMSWEEFLAAAGDNAGRMETFFDEFDFDEDTLAFFNGRTPLQVLAIAEPWCPDVVQNVAVIARISDEVPGMELSIVTRDGNPELMNEYLTGDKRRIPVIAFFDMTFRELGRWAGRCASADEWIFGEVAPDRSFDGFDEEKLRAFHEEYDRRFRDTY
ncbi:MAG TPA: thioredoxin family protein, partial [Chromatiales bacterium]|nr:thioredoxin family protein [Chromatiales bacterium]